MKTRNAYHWNIDKALLIGVLTLSLALVGVVSSCSSDSVTGASTSASPSGSFMRMSERDTDGDGIVDLSDADDDNDGTPDDSDRDDDNDGIDDSDESDRDGDGIIDDHDDDYVEIEGTVSSLGADSFQMYGFTITVGDNTYYESDNGMLSGFDGIAVGMYLEVEGSLVDDTTVDAYEVELEDDDEDEDDDDDDDYDDDGDDDDDDYENGS